MEKFFHAFLFTLFMFFSVSMAFNQEMQLETDPETGELYFDLNKNQKDSIDRLKWSDFFDRKNRFLN